MKDEKLSAEQLNEEILSQAKEPLALGGWFLPSEWWPKWRASSVSGFPAGHWIRILTSLCQVARHFISTAADGVARFPVFRIPGGLLGKPATLPERGVARKERTMSMTSPLDDVVAKGKEHYQAGRSFSQWSLIMVHQHGQAITPYLEDAWKLIGENTKIAQKRKQDMIIEAPFDTNEAPKSRILYRMVAPGRFAPVAKEDPPAKTAERLRLRQTIVAVAAIAFIVGGLFPPWLYTLDLADGPHARRDAGFAFILSSPKMEAAPDEFRSFRKFAGIQLDARRLLVEWACILAIGGAALFLCGRTVAKQDHKSA